MGMETMILRETGYQPSLTKHYEGAFAQGSGYLHIRASFEEGLQAAPQDEEYMRLPANVTIEKPRHPRSKCGTYVPGVTGLHPLLKEELVNLPNPLVFRVSAEGEALDMDESRMEAYERTLDLCDGVLTRSFLWRTRTDTQLECRYERFVSRERKNLIVQKMTYTCREGSVTLSLLHDIDEKVRTNGYQHFSAVEKQTEGNRAAVRVETDNGDTVFLVSEAFSDCAAFRPAEGGNGCAAELSLRGGETAVIWKLSAVCTSRDPEGGSFARLEQELEAARQDPERLRQENREAWNALWNEAAVCIEGDDRAQAAVNFSLYHLMRSASSTDDRIAVCAKGFAGEAYFGHFFWDTEIYLLPFFLYHFPETANHLASFRIRTLEGARKNAEAYGYSGARYPWESSVSGMEQCPNWQYADNEIHVTADVAFGLWHTWKATGDREFLFRAAPVFVETARYWLERVEHRADGSIHLNGVMGPDEYICFCNDNAYTNTMVSFALARTLDILELVEKEAPDVFARLGVEETFRAGIREVLEKLPVTQREDGVIWQCEDFERFEEPHFETFWPDRTKHFGAVVSQERNYRVKALKQADVLMLPYLFPKRYTREQVERNLAYYLPYTTHDSSLSVIIHSILFARLGRTQEAYEYFRRSLDIDLDGASGGAAEGIHIANCGGIWQALIFGFAGMLPAYESEEPVFAPNLPEGWKSLSFRLAYRGERYRVRVTGKEASVTREE